MNKMMFILYLDLMDRKINNHYIIFKLLKCARILMMRKKLLKLYRLNQSKLVRFHFHRNNNNQVNCKTIF